MNRDGSVVLVGPATVQPSGAAGVDTESVSAALSGIDDDIALLAERPVNVARLWRTLFASLLDEASQVTLVCPTWWPPRRINTVRDAAAAVVPEVTVVRRSLMLARCSIRWPAVVVEIAPHMVVVSRIPSAAGEDDDIRPSIAEPRDGVLPESVADALARAVTSLHTNQAVVIDCPEGIGGAPELAAMVVERLRARGISTVRVVDDAGLLRASAPAADPPPALCADDSRPATPRRRLLATLALVGAVSAAALAIGAKRDAEMAMTTLVEGHVAVRIPAKWSVERITAGPGSPRVQIASATDADAALHVAQVLVPSSETLEHTADTLRVAMSDQPAGVFTDFHPANQVGNRRAVTYRERRRGHDIRWTVFVDKSNRISIGCQSAPGRDDAVRYACEQAVASAHALTRIGGK
jgi:type VII secretion-associated protein (TIGR03931 family)